MIIGISGRKQSGKDTSFKIIREIRDLSVLGIKDEDSFIKHVLDNFEFKSKRCAETEKQFSFADALKQEVCINLLGLTHEQCYGTDEQKNSLTHLRWENMPIPQGLYKYQPALYNNGYMTAREVMQYVGSEIFRSIYPNVWVNRTINLAKRHIRDVNADKYPYPRKLAIITDVRFPNEGDAIKETGGFVVRLTSKIAEDAHMSENELDDYIFDETINNNDRSLENLVANWVRIIKKRKCI